MIKAKCTLLKKILIIKHLSKGLTAIILSKAAAKHSHSAFEQSFSLLSYQSHLTIDILSSRSQSDDTATVHCSHGTEILQSA